MKYTIASIEDGIVRLEADDCSVVNINADKLPDGVKEGDILILDSDEFIIDKHSTDARRKEVFDKYKRLFRK